MYNYNTSQRSRNLSISQATCICLFCTLLALFAPIEPAHAHKVNIFAYVEEDTIFTESYFNDGKKCINSIVTVFDDKGSKLLEGKTDKDGLFSFKIPQHTDLRIVLTASMGHRAEYVLKKAEFSDSDEGTTEPDAPAMPPSRSVSQGESGGQDHGPSLAEIVGGIGYIFGIIGIVMFFRSKRNK